ncbi:peptidase family m13 protein [Colletotrichum truncatum]|uniref:Peptidase family m13 protein n=1 Tax=Colletotrichum truncatum TaxID=5467 RepID=A0ACC3Z3K5_COLTU|nr:peptidase family m13 protein [Colletotrichum truncatum]KAF6795531.1 peptidase family m13 protein [Colletotrichum truncatum]
MAPTIDGIGASSNLCTTPTCLEIASGIIQSHAPNYTEIDPCTDFDKLACSGYQSRHAPGAGSGRAAPFSETTEEIAVIMKNILEGPYPSGADSGFITASLSKDQIPIDQDNFKLITEAYNACLNNTALEATGLKPLLSVIDRIAEAFPVSSEGKDPQRKISKDDASELGKVLLFFAKYGISTFESVGVDFDDVNPHQTIISILPGGLPLLTGEESDQTLADYEDVMASVLQAVHPANLSRSDSQKLSHIVTKFERDLQALEKTDDSREGRDKPARKFKLEDVTRTAPELDHGSIIKALVPQDYTPEQLVFSPGYFGNLSQLLSNTTAETLQTFFVWRATTALSDYVVADVTTRLNEMMSTLGGLDPAVVGKAPRWRRCVSTTNSGPTWTQFPPGLGWISSRFFLDKAYSKEARELTTSLMSSIQNTFIARLGDKDWLSPAVKKTAEEKVNAVTKKIGYPDLSPETMNPKSLSDYFSGASIGSCYLDNMLSLAAVSTNRTWSYLGKPVDRALWLTMPSVVNAYYFPTFNDIVILAGVQQKPLFAVGYPSYLNYGSLGSVLGHELTHGFDNNGHNYAPNGSLVNWWDDSSIKGFEERTKCFVDQYQNFTRLSPNGTLVPVRGNFTLGENIADAGGAATSYAAWKRAQADGKVQDFDLPGLERFSHDQLFFLQWAQGWCEVTATREYDIMLLIKDPHSPGFARIKGPLDNSREFRRAFNCPNQKPTCELW